MKTYIVVDEIGLAYYVTCITSKSMSQKVKVEIYEKMLQILMSSFVKQVLQPSFASHCCSFPVNWPELEEEFSLEMYFTWHHKNDVNVSKNKSDMKKANKILLH